MMKPIEILFSLCLLLGCNKNTAESMIPLPDTNSKQLSYLALGDSYTIGEAVAQQESFPYQLVSQLKSEGRAFTLPPKVIAKTGWTTDELQEAIKSAAIKQQFDMVTLLVGVNNQYRSYPQETYRKEFKELLQTAVDFAGKNKQHVFVVSIPDWGVTPFGKSSGRQIDAIAQQIDAFNAIAKAETLGMGISYTDITPESRRADTDLTLVAADGLHPSGKMYHEWALEVAKAVKTVFK